MEFVFFSGLNQKGEFGEHSFAGPDVESCFSVLNGLVRAGWHLESIKLKGDTGKAINLSVESFDGNLVREPLALIQRTWEILLAKPNGRIEAVKIRVVCAQNAEITMQRATQILTLVSQQQQSSKEHIENLMQRIDLAQKRIQAMKAKWGVV
ncbi:hypothetical protein [Spirosoma sp. KNUC1025]|uniref:hypothetical protein n=1 Tax=Spirosoma sp. KNUC1025 TaxID=2894082 RepID=UPI0038651912|nr:hypothetical protein LN737_19370 [Spirosoma sp. KNUC1025]